MKKLVITSKEAPAAVGPYSQAVEAGGFIFCSGMIPLRPDGLMAEQEITAQTRQAFLNLSAVLKEAGLDLSSVVKTTVYLTRMEDFGEMNAVYASFFNGSIFPARATIEVSRLPKDALVEIEAVAVR